MKRHILAIAIAATLLGLASCETAPESDAQLAQARSAIAQAEANPNVAKFAPTELDRARKLLVNAEGVAKQQGADDATAVHYAYLATQMARISEQRAQEQVATARIKASEAERKDILLSGRGNEVHQPLEDLQAAQTPRGIVLTLNDALFDSGKAQLKSGARRSIDEIAAFLGENPGRRVQVEAFTDSDGTNDYNLELSQSRADAVAMAIIKRGIDAQRVRALGYGEEFPVAGNTSDGSRQRNRRVEIIVSNGDDAIPGRAVPGQTLAGSP